MARRGRCMRPECRFDSCPLHMSFWEEHAKAEAAHVEAERAKAPPSAQDAPSGCVDCGQVRADVLLGYCSPCFQDWVDQRCRR